MPLRYPAVAAHDVERPCESRAIHRQNLPQFALSDLPCKGKCLQNGELGGPQSYRTQSIFIKLSERSGCPAKACAHAGERWGEKPCHNLLDVYAYNGFKLIDNSESSNTTNGIQVRF